MPHFDTEEKKKSLKKFMDAYMGFFVRNLERQGRIRHGIQLAQSLQCI